MVLHTFYSIEGSGNLQKPSVGMVSICHTTEKMIQKMIRRNGGQLLHGHGITSVVVVHVLAETAGKDLFPQLNNHMSDTCVAANHVHVLGRMASSWLCKVQFSHFARTE